MLAILFGRKKAVRIVCNIDRHAPILPCFSALNILCFADIVKVKLGNIMFRASKGLLCNDLQRRFGIMRGDVRNNRLFKNVYCRTTLKAQCISVEGPKFFNSLPLYLKCAVNSKSFNRQIKYYYLASYVNVS